VGKRSRQRGAVWVNIRGLTSGFAGPDAGAPAGIHAAGQAGIRAAAPAGFPAGILATAHAAGDAARGRQQKGLSGMAIASGIPPARQPRPLEGTRR
jgi:hypothetical protein